MIDIAERIEGIFSHKADRFALCIDQVKYTYAQLRQRVLCIQAQLEGAARPAETLIGVVAVNHLDTYAAVLAVLRSGRAFVPLNPEHPGERNASIVRQAGLRTVLATDAGRALDAALLQDCTLLLASDAATASPSAVAAVGADALAYLLFTSGSTGEPKGVPITRGNLAAFLDALSASECAMFDSDRVLQMFDLTFDFSIAAYLAPLASGACVYTVGNDKAKYAEIYGLLCDEALTVAPLVPSVLNYLKPYFDEIDLPQLRLSFFCGEALLADIVGAWEKCAPASVIVNFYGPTEATVFATYYHWSSRDGKNKTLNGVVSIGRPMVDNFAIVVDDNLAPVARGEKGELCLAGPQLTPGYWQDPQRDARTFFHHTLDGAALKFYRTGDIVSEDEAGDLLFCGRVDHQIKLQGYRVELGEIEHHVRELLSEHAFVVVPFTTAQGSVSLILVVERYTGDLKQVVQTLREHIPSYMVPARAVSLDSLPLNANGKIDRKALQKQFEVAHG
ncbi:peptide synthase [Janthinobacterium sp. BJB412]|nr:peptide synthase [Janthinobacterium sp. BJB412]